MSRPRILTEARLIEAAREQRGNVSDMADALGRPRSTVYLAIHAHEAVKLAIFQERERFLDACEKQVYRLAEDGTAWALRYVLSSQGRHRGWSERYEPVGEGVNEQVIRVVYDVEPADDEDDVAVLEHDDAPAAARRPAPIHRRRGVLRRTDTHAE